MTIRLLGTLDMNDIKKEDAMRYDCSLAGNVEGIAIVVDGATGFQKDIDQNGNIYVLPDITEGEYSSARIWADTLADEMLVLAKNQRNGMVEILQSAIENATRKMPVVMMLLKIFNLRPDRRYYAEFEAVFLK